jgi:hypothetical protein
MTVRVYFNKRGALPWSVDSGPGTEEFQTGASVDIRLPSRTMFDPSAGDDENTPTAWVEVKNARILRIKPGTVSEYDIVVEGASA